MVAIIETLEALALHHLPDLYFACVELTPEKALLLAVVLWEAVVEGRSSELAAIASSFLNIEKGCKSFRPTDL